MKFDVTATIKEIGAIETVGAKGFQKRNLILSETSGDYENLVCVEFSGDKLSEPEQYAEGQEVTVSGFVNCREWNGKYFSSLRGSFIKLDQQTPQQAPQPEFGSNEYAQAQTYQQPQVQPQVPDLGQTPYGDDIPF